MDVLQPVEYRDFSKGVYRKVAVSQALVPLNSVSHSLNFNFDTTIGSAVVRPGTTVLGATVASGKSPLGFFEFVTGGSAINDLLVVYPSGGAGTGTVSYYDTSW